MPEARYLANMKTESELGKTITTRWWWVRHAPVISPQEVLYGQADFPCDTHDVAALSHLAEALPVTPHWIISPLQRTRQTAEAILAAPGGEPLGRPNFRIEPGLIEQQCGIWENTPWDEFYAKRKTDRPRCPYWATEADEVLEGGESYVQAFARAQAAIDRLMPEYLGQDVVVVGHGGVIRAGVAHGLGLPPSEAQKLQILNLSLTRIDYKIEPNGWKFARLITMNRTLSPPPLSYDHRYAPRNPKGV